MTGVEVLRYRLDSACSYTSTVNFGGISSYDSFSHTLGGNWYPGLLNCILSMITFLCNPTKSQISLS